MNTVTQTPVVEPTHPAVGARITGVDLRLPVDDKLAGQLRDLFARHAVLCFPDQKIDADGQAAFAALFGKVDRADNDPDDPDRKQSTPGVKYVSNIRENGKPIGSLPDGEMHFHSDGSHRDTPYRATTLFAIEVPDRGGETRFASMAAAYDALPADLQTRLDGLSARHVFNYNKTTREEMRCGDDVAHAIHPLVRIHPDTGRKSLYLSRLMTRNIVGMDDAKGEELLTTLLDHCEKPEFVYDHAWRPGDLVVWDNRSVNHARNDFPADQRRLLRRYTVSDRD
ncbi:MAG: TauD/TfdA dioxygenase family protein [Alphaproteobacteria bacterium]